MLKHFFLHVGHCTLWKLGCVFPCCLYTCNFRFCITYLPRLCTRINDINESLCPFFLTSHWVYKTNWLGLDLLILIFFYMLVLFVNYQNNSELHSVTWFCVVINFEMLSFLEVGTPFELSWIMLVTGAN